MKRIKFYVMCSASTLLCVMSCSKMDGGGDGGGGKQGEIPAGALPGKFTVNSDGKQVYFSQGNLTYNVSTKKWAFYEHQYDCAAGYDASLISTFTWGYDASKSIVPNGNEYVTGHDTQYGETFNKSEDWGYVFGGESSVWRTLTKAEWIYLFNHHSSKWITVNSVNGYVFAPDGFTGELVDSYADDAALAVDKLVFLPAAGGRDGSRVFEVGLTGYYWSSSAVYSDGASMVDFYSSGAYAGDYDSRYHGNSVRLITEVK